MSQVHIGVDFSTLQENSSSTQTQSVGRTLIDGEISIGVRKDLPYYLSIGYMNTSSVESYDDLSVVRLDSTVPYVGGELHFWRKSPTSLFFGGYYSPYSKLTVKKSGQKEMWDGDTVLAKITASFNMSENYKIIAGIKYVSQNFVTRRSADVTGKQSYSQSYFMPSIGLALAF